MIEQIKELQEKQQDMQMRQSAIQQDGLVPVGQAGGGNQTDGELVPVGKYGG